MYTAEIKVYLDKYKWWLLGITIVAIPAGIIEWEIFYMLSGQEWLPTRETLVDSIYSITAILSFFAFDHIKLPGMRLVSDWGTKSYGIYLLHPLFVEFGARMVYRFLPGILGLQWLLQPLLILLGLGIPLFIMWFVNRTPLRRFYSILFG